MKVRIIVDYHTHDITLIHVFGLSIPLHLVLQAFQTSIQLIHPDDNIPHIFVSQNKMKTSSLEAVYFRIKNCTGNVLTSKPLL